MRSFWVATAFLAVAGSLAAQTLTPRELFYGQGRAPSAKRPVPGTRPTKPPLGSGDAARGKLVDVDTSPLGLKYTILKRTQDGEYTQVGRDTTFASGDQIKLVIESNSAGYLYVVTQGASHKWKPVFFANNGDAQSNRVEPGGHYSIPAGKKVMSFESPAGAEKLFIVLSRQPETDLEKLIYSLDKQPKADEPSPTMLAENRGPAQDDVVQRLRKTYSRDLIIESVDDTKKAATDQPKQLDGSAVPPEKAVYVVNPKAGANGRLVADIELRHE
jgi:Domain of unknown function (DUF4384)